MKYILVILALIAIYTLFKSNRNLSRKTKVVPKRKPRQIQKASLDKPYTPQKKYNAVQLVPCEQSCLPATWVADKLYLVEELSSLPLTSCDKILECECRFSHHDDRRHNEDRRSGSTVLQNAFRGDESRARKKRGRRSSD